MRRVISGRIPSVLGLVIGILVTAGVTGAQAPSVLSVGDRVRIAAEAFNGEAMVQAMTDSSIVVDAAAMGTRVELPFASISSVEAYRGTRSRASKVRRRAVWGAAIGGALGVAIGVAGADDDAFLGWTAGEGFMWGLLVGGTFGGTAGALTGLLARPGERWERVMLPQRRAVGNGEDAGPIQ